MKSDYQKPCDFTASKENMFSEKEAEHDVFRDSIRRLMRDFGHDYFLRTSNEKSNARELWNALGNAGGLASSFPKSSAEVALVLRSSL